VDPGIVWFDAHGDVQTLETTASANLGGPPLRLLALRQAAAQAVTRAWASPKLVAWLRGWLRGCVVVW
jgi:arginase family enzyme